MPTTSTPADKLYSLLADEEDARVCTDIADEACRVVPGNFFRILFAGILSKLGDELSNAKTVLPWLLNLVQAPAFLTGLLVPVRESGSLLPQLLIAGYIRRLEQRKLVWVLGSVIQGLSVAVMAAVAMTMTGTAAGTALLSLLILFSLARGLCSVAHKDVIGKTVPRTRRGRLSGWSASTAGLVSLAVGLVFIFTDINSGLPIVLLLLCGACSWISAAVVFGLIREFRGQTEGGANAVSTAISRFTLLRSDPQFCLFVTVRSLLLCSALMGPFIVQLATQSQSSSIAVLGLFLVASSTSSILSAPIWGVFADRSSRNVMIIAALLTSALGLVLILITWLLPDSGASSMTYPVAFFILGIAHNGVRLGRKTYLVDMAKGNRRTDYVAVSNTVIGGLLLVIGTITALLGAISAELAIACLAAAGLCGSMLGTGLINVEKTS